MSKIAMEFDKEEMKILKHCVEVYKNKLTIYDVLRPESVLPEYRIVEKLFNNIRSKLD